MPSPFLLLIYRSILVFILLTTPRQNSSQPHLAALLSCYIHPPPAKIPLRTGLAKSLRSARYFLAKVSAFGLVLPTSVVFLSFLYV